ncbi:MAG: FecR protein, partial [Planctomycetota bacterium]
MDDDGLIDRWLAGEAGPEDVRRLASLLDADRAARMELLRRARLDAAIRSAAQAGSSRRRRLRIVALAAAAAVAVLAGAAALLMPANGGAEAPAWGPVLVAPATIELPDGTRIETAPGTVARARPGVGGDGLHLETGAVEVHAAPQAPGRRLTVATAHGTAAVVGTRFRVATATAGTWVAVDEGVVEVAAGGAVRRIVAGGGAWFDGTGILGRSIRIAPGTATGALQAAIDRLGPGDELVLAAGEHRPGRGLHLRGATVSGWRTLRGEPGAVLLGRDWSALAVEGAARFRIAGLAVRPDPGTPDTVIGNGIRVLDSHDIEVVGCDIAGMAGDGIAVQGSDRVRVAGNRAAGNGAGSRWGQGGISVIGSIARGDGPHRIVLDGNRVDGNRITRPNSHGNTWSGGHGIGIFQHDAGAAGPDLPAYPGEILVRATIAHGNDGAGIHIYRAPTTRIAGAILHRNARGPGPAGEFQAFAATGAAAAGILAAPAPGIPALRHQGGIRIADCRQWGGSATSPGFAPL